MHHRKKFPDDVEDEIRKAGEISYRIVSSCRYCSRNSCLLLKEHPAQRLNSRS